MPAYPRDLNPIEEAFSKVKTLLKTATCTKEALVEAIARTLAAVTRRTREAYSRTPATSCGIDPCEHRCVEDRG